MRRRARASADAAALIGGARVGLGIALLVAPRASFARLVGGPVDDATALAVRMLAVRDLGLGLGALRARSRRGAGLRGWTEAGALADAVDAVAIVGSGAVRPWRRALLGAAAGAAGVTGVGLARRLGPSRVRRGRPRRRGRGGRAG